MFRFLLIITVMVLVINSHEALASSEGVQGGGSSVNILSPDEKLSILGALLTSDKLKPSDKLDLIGLFESRGIEAQKYNINSFECSFVGRSIRFECEIRLGFFNTDEKTDVVLIETTGFLTTPTAIQTVKFTPFVP